MIMNYSFPSLHHYFRHAATQIKKLDDVYLLEKKDGEETFSTISYREVMDATNAVTAYLHNMGLEKQAKIALIIENCPQYIMFDQGLMQIGLVNVSIYPTLSESEITAKMTGTPSSMDGSEVCDLDNIDLQKWVLVSVVLNNKTCDVYMDGKLARSCVLPSFYKVDAGGYSAYLLSYGGFGGQISTTTMYDTALNPESVHKLYMAGPEPITSFGGWLGSIFAPGLSLSVSVS
jgi:hypothetical protein